MPKLPVLLTKLDDDIPDFGAVSARLHRHLMRLRDHKISKSDLEPLLCQYQLLFLPALTLSDLIGFAKREGAARGQNAPALDAVVETLHYHPTAPPP